MEKTKEIIREEILNNLAVSLGVNIREQGAIAVAIVDSVIDEIWYLYQELDFAKKQAYLSTSTGEYTNLIAALVGTERDALDTDDDLKIKASNSVYRFAKGNRIAIEEAALAVDGVASIDYRPFGAGVGSFVMYVYPEVDGDQHRLLERVETALSDVVADGVYFEVKEPEQIVIDTSIIMQFNQSVGAMEKQQLKQQAQAVTGQYINSLRRNDVLIVNEIIQRVMQLSDNILDIAVVDFKVNGVQRSVSNIFPASDERFVRGDITII